MTSPLDPLPLAQALIRCPSVTPADAGALAVIEAALGPLGFSRQRLPFQAPGTDRVENLFARRAGGRPGRHFCFAGHSDVVPPGRRESWSLDPFAGAVENGVLYGRGAADMKGAIAAFVAAAAAFLAARPDGFPGTLSLLITGDEEGPSVNGTKPTLEALARQGERFDACLVGEPTNPARLGEMIKIGRRGSLTARLRVLGVQGHTAYPHLADNPIHRLAGMIAALTAPLDAGSAHFEPSTLQFASADVGNAAGNVIPAEAQALFNARFNDAHSAASLEAELRRRLDAAGGRYALAIESASEPFLTLPGALSALLAACIAAETGISPALSTTGGTSDARFIKDYCQVVEFGLTGQSMHKVDEHVRVDDLNALARIYRRVLEGYFS